MAKKLKDRIEELEKKQRSIAGNLIDAIWVVDAKTLTYDYVSPSIEKISGLTVDEYINSTLYERMAPESYEKLAAILKEEVPKFKKGIKIVRTEEIQLIHKTGYLYWAEIKAKLIQEGDGPIKIIGITREITDRKKVEQQQNKLIEKLGEALAEKDRLLKENDILRGLLPICSGCKRIRDKKGRWWPFDAYVEKETQAKLTHTICSDCTHVFYPEL